MADEPFNWGDRAKAVRGRIAHAWRSAVGGKTPALAVYAFGKHPAFADFIDVARLPPVPAPFRHFHDHLRTTLERDGGPTDPRLIAWAERGTAAVLWVQPSHDRGDTATGRSRRCPLLLGVSAARPLPDLLAFAGTRLPTLGQAASDADDPAAVVDPIRRAAAEWPDRFAAGPHKVPTDGLAAVAIAAVGNAPAPVVVVVAAPDLTVCEPVALSALTANECRQLGFWMAPAAELQPPAG